MITCESCGEILQDGTQFCSNCGALVENPTVAVPDAVTSPIPDVAESAIQPEDATATESAAPVQSPTNDAAPLSTEYPQNPYAMPQQTNTQPQQTYAQPQYSQQQYTPPQQPAGGTPPYYSQQAGYTQQTGYGQSQNYSYPQQNYTYPQPRQTDGKSVCSLIMGILSLVTSCVYGFGLLFSILGIVFAVLAKKTIAVKNDPTDNSAGMATGGLVCSIIGGIISIVVIFIMIIAVAVAVYDY